jgi:hypothetical protein
MPLTGTPLPEPDPQAPAADVDALAAVEARSAKVEGATNPARPRALSVVQNQAATVRWTFRDGRGDPVRLGAAQAAGNSSSSASSASSTTEASLGRVRLRLLEALSYSTSAQPHEVEGRVRLADQGEVEFDLPAAAVAKPAVMALEVGYFNEADDFVFANQGYLVVNRGLFTRELTPTGPPTLQQVRLRLRDSAAEDNFLLAETEFDDAEIADALVRVVQYVNEAPPAGAVRFTTTTFAYPEQAMDGVVALLYRTAAAHYHREHVAYQNAGVTFDDKNKGAVYEAVAAQRWQRFADWVRAEKRRHNIMGGFGGFGSPYGRRPLR